jgi:starch synthase (maltosyl-transferring)
MILYDLFPLLAGPFSQWGRHCLRAAGMGFEWILLNPIHKTGASRSLYSVADYFAVNPVLLDPGATASPDEQVRQMIARARAAGLRVMLDLVINHCATDSALIQEHPDWFVRDGDGRIKNPSCQHNGETVVWRDLAQFDHRHTRDPEGLYGFCLRVVEHLAGLGFEGFRCDAAYQIPTDFWRRLLRDARARHPRLCFVAETLGCVAEETKETARAGFDFVFNSSKWWNFRDGWLLEGYNLVRETAPSISFPESHDTPRLAEELNGNINGLKQRYLFSALFSSGVMIPAGFEFGMRKPLHVVHTTPADWHENGIDLRTYIKQVNTLKRQHPVFQEEGPTSFVPCTNPNILLMRKSSTRHRDEALLILNQDLWSHQEFFTDHLRNLLPAGGPLRDVSPEYPLEQVPEPFHYALRPGQGIVLVGARN